MRTVAILPVKSFGRAKQRLGEAYPDRPALAAAMVADVLDALTAVPSLDGVIVVTAEPIAAQIAAELGVQVVHDPVESGQSPAAIRGVAAALGGAGESAGGETRGADVTSGDETRGAGQALDGAGEAGADEAVRGGAGEAGADETVRGGAGETAGGETRAAGGAGAALGGGAGVPGRRIVAGAPAERVLLVPGDCPALDPAEVEALLARTAPVVIVPDRHGTGTNALLLAPPDVMTPAFGEGSFERHSALARRAGTEPEIAQVRTLGLDVDTPDDLDALRRALSAYEGGAVRTRSLLEQAQAA